MYYIHSYSVLGSQNSWLQSKFLQDFQNSQQWGNTLFLFTNPPKKFLQRPLPLVLNSRSYQGRLKILEELQSTFNSKMLTCNLYYLLLSTAPHNILPSRHVFRFIARKPVHLHSAYVRLVTTPKLLTNQRSPLVPTWNTTLLSKTV